ncbi:MAG TPA: glycerol-3-phosphate acyltransferase [Dehalococcoidia bacterium]|nr:glycerol-3-phosphate acyltransferase [Dehalococcoidia bacterium]
MSYRIPSGTRYTNAVRSIGTVEAFYSTLLAVSAFCLGACPFSVWVGQWLLGKDIRDYGDGNPGAVNVFRAGGRKSAYLAAILDIGKGVPFVVLAHSFFGLTEVAVMAVGLSAILGHAFSPILRLKGGKSLAVTAGVLLALPQHEVLVVLLIFMFFGFLIIEIDAWRVMLGAAGSLIYLVTTKGSSWEAVFMLCVLVILAVKHFDDLQTIPRFKGRLISWLRSRKTADLSRQ